MRAVLRRLRGALGMGVTWAIGWAFAGVLIGVASVLLPFLPWQLFFEYFDAPLPALAVPGFVGGATFSIVLAIVGRRRRFDELSMPRFALWGALGGVLLAMVPAAMVALGLATAVGESRPFFVTAVISGPLAILSAASAVGSLAVARMSEDRELLASSEEVGEVGLTAAEAQTLLGR